MMETQCALFFLCDVRVSLLFWVLPSMKKRVRVRLLACLGVFPPFRLSVLPPGCAPPLLGVARLLIAGAVAMRRAPAWEILVHLAGLRSDDGDCLPSPRGGC